MNQDNNYEDGMPLTSYLLPHPYHTDLSSRSGIPRRILEAQAVYERCIAIRRMYNIANFSYTEIGRRFGISSARVCVILGRHSDHICSVAPITRWGREITDIKVLADLIKQAAERDTLAETIDGV